MMEHSYRYFTFLCNCDILCYMHTLWEVAALWFPFSFGVTDNVASVLMIHIPTGNRIEWIAQ